MMDLLSYCKTDRQREILTAVLKSRTQKEAANKLGIAVRNVEVALQRIRKYADEQIKRHEIELEKKNLVITWAQNATPAFSQGLKSLQSFCKHNNAQLIVIKGRYKNPTSIWSANDETDDWYANDLIEYLTDQRLEASKNLTLCGDIKIQPTAVNPLSGLKTLTGGHSCIFGHPQICLESVATPQNKLAKLCITTGAITKPNFTDSKAGKKGEFHHQYGATFVRLDGHKFHTRQLEIDKSGKFYDLDKCYNGNEITTGHQSEAFISGDFHAKFLDGAVKKAWWTGKNSLLKLIKPKIQVFHDLFDGYFGSHHHKADPFLQYKKHVTGENAGRNELKQTFDHLNDCLLAEKNYIVKSNHDEHLDRWLNETDWRKDPVNADLYLELAMAKVKSIKDNKHFDALEYALGSFNKNCIFLQRNKPLFVKGHALHYHGDKGANGSRGSANSFNQIGTKAVIGHSHSPKRDKGVMQCGLSAVYNLEYATGSPSSWMHTAAIIYKNGTGTLINSIEGEY